MSNLYLCYILSLIVLISCDVNTTIKENEEINDNLNYYEYTKPLTIGNYTCYDYVYNNRPRRSFIGFNSDRTIKENNNYTIQMGVAYRNSPYRSSSKQEMVKFHGDINIGGLFPMHDSGDEQHLCGSIKEGKGIQRMEAMLFAVDMINGDDKLLPNLTLGVHILDTCSRDTYALEQTMEFVKSSLTTVDHTLDDYQCDDGSSPHLLASDPVVGVIGAASSSVSVMVANILRLFQIPQISYASTSVELSDKSRFGFFSRVVPPDSFQAQVMVDIVKLFKWTYVSTIAEEGEYGERGIEYFKYLAAKEKICIAEGVKIGRNAKPEDFIRIINKLYTKSNARGVVLFVDEDNCRKLLNASQVTGKVGHFAWLGSDSWGRKLYPVKGQEDSAVGAITILPKRNSLPDFDQYFKQLNPLTNKRNPWFKPFWEQHFNCYLTPTMDSATSTTSDYSTSSNGGKSPEAINLKSLGQKKCTGKEILVKYEQEGLVPFVVDAVYAMAHAIHNLLADRCRPKVKTDQTYFDSNLTKNNNNNHDFWSPSNPCIREPIKGQELLSYIRKVSFPSLQGMTVKFNKDGDAPGRYDIFQYQKIKESILIAVNQSVDNSTNLNYSPPEYDYIRIGNWESDVTLVFNLSQLDWPNFGLNQNESYTEIPSSVCSRDCDRGQFRQVHEGQPCCWHCSYCGENEKIYNLTDCVSCPIGYVPDEFKETCHKLPLEYMRWNSPWTILPAVFASLGIVSTVFTFMTFIRFNETPVIMASGRELCYILLLGLMVCYIVSLLILSKPTLLTCTVVRIGLCLGLCICYSAILTKTNRISRIFNRGVKNGLKRPSYTSPKSQVIICTCLVSVQLVFVVAWLIRDPPSVKEVIQKLGSRTVAVLQCGISATATAISLIYNMLLILLCTMYAFKTRKIPDNFNEAKYIVFTMYSTCIVWLAFIPIYFGTNNDFKIQLASLSTCISISAAVNIGCLFIPKLYICLFQPYKNTRHTGVQASGGVGTFTSNSTSNALRFARPTSSGGCAAAIAAATQAISAHQSAPTIVLPEASSGDLKTTSTTNGEWTSPSPEDEQNSAI